MANRKLKYLGNIIPRFLVFKFSILPYSRNQKLGFKNIGKRFPRFVRFLRFPSFRPGRMTCQKQQQQSDLKTCLNNSFYRSANTLMSMFEDLTSKIVEKSPSRAKVTGKRLRKGRQSDDERGSFESSLESESEVNSCRAKADERKESHKVSGGESEHEYDDRVSLHVDDDSKVAGNLNNTLGTSKESKHGDSDSGLKSLIQERDKDEEIKEKSIKI